MKKNRYLVRLQKSVSAGSDLFWHNNTHGFFLFVLWQQVYSRLGNVECHVADIGSSRIEKVFQNSRFLLFVGANTLFYFAFHGKGYSLLQTIIERAMSVLSVSHTFLIDEALGFVIVFLDALLLIIPAMLVNRYCPWLLGKGFKLWKA